jgi:hypothetical protein
MESYLYLTEKIEQLETIGATFGDFARGLVRDQIVALTSVRDNLAVEVVING